jgi:hypothetical protein
MEHDARVHKIMANADALKGKEYIDFLVDFLMGKMGDGSKDGAKAGDEKKAAPKKLPKFCKMELS